MNRSGVLSSFGVILAVAACAGNEMPQKAAPAESLEWIEPGSDLVLPAYFESSNQYGRVGFLNTAGPIHTREHPFFEPQGPNGRACVSCHQPADGMSISVESLQQRWLETGGQDPVFAQIDGQNCPNLPHDQAASHSLLLERGLFRVGIPWPPRETDGTLIEPQFTIEVLRDPTGCNLDPEYGLYSDKPTISVYRRPRPATNTRYTAHRNMDGPFILPFIQKNGRATARDPETGELVSMNLMADARYPTLRTQADNAAISHLEQPNMTDETLNRIVAFERGLFSAQAYDSQAGSLTDEYGPIAFGPQNLTTQVAGTLGNNERMFVFPMGTAWLEPAPGLTAEQIARRASIRRGHDIFFYRTFWISDSMHINTVGLGNPIKRTCSTCHNQHMTGMDVANGWVDLGTTNLPHAMEEPQDSRGRPQPVLPLFKVTCKPDVAPHPFYGREIFTQDPGRALISGRCDDVGAIVIQQMRALSARAPYFVNGSAQTLEDVVIFYDRRYNIGFTDQERRDLVAFMSAL